MRDRFGAAKLCIYFLICLIFIQAVSCGFLFMGMEEHHFITPIETKVTFKRAGSYKLTLESGASGANTLAQYPIDRPEGLIVGLTRLSDNAQIPIVPTNPGQIVSPARNTDIGQAHINQAGEYQLSATGSDDARLIKIDREPASLLAILLICSNCCCQLTSVLLILALIIGLMRKPRQDDNIFPPSPFEHQVY